MGCSMGCGIGISIGGGFGAFTGGGCTAFSIIADIGSAAIFGGPVD